MRSSYSLTTLRAFEAVARTGSFSEAARELNVTRPAVSKQIRLLEEAMGCQLFDRASGGVKLTDQGRELFAGLHQAFDLIAATTERVARHAREDRTVKVLVERDFASSWLAHRIGSFLLANPGISVEVAAERNGRLNMGESYSFRIFYGNQNCFENEELAGETLCNWIDLPVCTADYARAHIEADGKFDRCHFLLDGNYNPWPEWFAATGFSDPGNRATYTTFNETTLCLSAAMAGGGITIGDSFLTMGAFESGQLIAPIPVGIRSIEVYSLYSARSAKLSPAEKLFRNWLVDTVNDYEQQVEARFAALGLSIVDSEMLAA